MKQQALWDKFEDHLLNIQLTKNRIGKLQRMFKIVTRALNLETVKREQIEAFLNKLNRNEFLKLNGENYSGSTKSDLKKFLKQYYKHTRGKDEYFPKEVSWIKTKIAKDEKPEKKTVVTQEQIVKIVRHFRRADFKMLTLILFDSGFRIQEGLSIRKKGLTWGDFDEEGNKCWWVECTESKSETRTVPIQLFTEEINNYVNTADYRTLKDDDLVFGKVKYTSYCTSLREASVKVIGKPLSPHCLRHSSATMFAELYQGDMIQLANRYGWSYSSRELSTYIRKSKAKHRLPAKKVFASELLKLKEENKKLRKDFDEMLARMELIERYRKVKG